MKKLAILGKLPTKLNAPFDDADYDIWSMNLHSDTALIPRVDKWFDIHKKPENVNADVLRKDFPFEKCHNLVGGNYFNNSVSYMIAYAILQEYKHIELYGMRFSCDHERRHSEYYNVRELVFFARGKGTTVTAPVDEILLQDFTDYSNIDGKDFDLY
jgi:hypothetical protein